MKTGGDMGGSPMETLTAIAVSLLSSSSSKLSKFSSTDASSPSSPLLLLVPGGRLLWRCLLLALHALLSLLSLLLLLLSHPSPHSSPSLRRPSLPPGSDTDPSAAAAGTCAARALSHVLAAVACVPVASRKYGFVRSLADRLLDDNLRFAGLGDAGGRLRGLNRAALSAAFSRTLRRLETAVASPGPSDRSLDLILGAVKSGMRRWAAATVAEGEEEMVPAEKLAAEALWLAEKMAECGAAGQAAARWGAAKRLARLALAADPRLQVAFVRVSALLFKHANSKLVEEEERLEEQMAFCRMAMLTSWLPLLCRASNGTDSPVLSTGEKAEMVRVLEELITKLSWDQQEEVLALWLHHFTSCPDSDWPNLESCYMRWYAESRKLLCNE